MSTPVIGVFGNQGAKPLMPLLPSLPGSGEPLVQLFDDGEHGDGMANDGWYGTSGSYDTYGNQAAKPLVPSLPGGGGTSNTMGGFYPSDDAESYIFQGGPWLENLGRVNFGSLHHRVHVSKMHPFSGEFCESAVDMCIPSRGPDFVLRRIYRSRTGDDTTVGNNWDHSCNIYLEQYGAKLILRDGTGRKDFYSPTEPNTWAADGFFRELVMNPEDTFTLTFADMGKMNFNPFDGTSSQGKVNAITDRNGNTMSFAYDAAGRLITTRDALDNEEYNRDITFSYNASGFLESVTDWTGRQVNYEYYNIGEAGGSVGDLKSVTTPAVLETPTGNDFPDGKTTIYTYSTGFDDENLNHNLLTITDSKGQVYLENTYGTDPVEVSYDHVTRQILGESYDIIDITYMRQIPKADNNYAVTRAITNDRAGNIAEHLFDNLNRLVIWRQYTGRANPDLPTSIDPNENVPINPLRLDDPPFFETRYEYNTDSLPVRITNPNGSQKQFAYDETNASPRSQGNLLQYCALPGSLGADQSQIIESFEYDSLSNKVTDHVDARGFESHFDYDANGNCIGATNIVPGSDPNIVHQWQYNEFGQLTASVLPSNSSGHKRRDELSYFDESDGYQNGHLDQVVIDSEYSALTTNFEYDDVGNLILITDPLGHDTQYDVNQLNQVVRRTSREVADGGGVRYQRDCHYDENNNVVQVDLQNKDEQGVLQPNTHFTTNYEYDSLNRLIRTAAEVDSARAVLTECEYDDNDGTVIITFGDGVPGNVPPTDKRLTFLYDERALIYQTVKAADDPNVSTTQFDYDGNGNLKKIYQGLEDTPRVTSYEYDGYGRLTSLTDPMSNVVEYQYDVGSNLVGKQIEGELTDIAGDVNNTRLYEASYEYDSLNRLVSSETAFFDPNTQLPLADGSSITQYFYSDNSQIIKLIDDNSNETTFDYDTTNRLRMATDAQENTFVYSYDQNSNVTRITEMEISDLGSPDETFISTYQYDNLNRLVSVMDNTDNTTEYAYDSHHNLRLRTDALNHQTRYTYDGLNRLIETVRDMDDDGPDGDGTDITTTQTWDDSSQITSRIDANGNTTAFEYDALNRLTKISYADGTEKSFDYDVHHNIIESTDAAGNEVAFTYDLLNRLTTRSITLGAGVSSDTTFEIFQYDGLSRLVYAENDDFWNHMKYASMITRYDYDKYGRTIGTRKDVWSTRNVVLSSSNSAGTVTSTFDGVGNKLSCTYPGGRTITITYDALNRKKTIADSAATIATYDYIGPGRLERRSYGNDIQCDYTYDIVKRIIGTTHTHSTSAAVIDQRSYQWDEVYNKTQSKDVRAGGSQLTYDYTYDAANRLINTIVTDNSTRLPTVVRDTDYALDGVGNRTMVTGDNYPGTYTMNSTLPEPADFQMNQYTNTPMDVSRSYDLNGNLMAINYSVGQNVTMTYDYRNRMVSYTDEAAETSTTYAYDALGRRFEKVVDADGTPQTTRYFYNGRQVIEEQGDGGSTLATYVYGNYVNEALNMQRGGNDYYYHCDDFFTVMAVTDDAAFVVERYEYQDYGEPSFFDSSGSPLEISAIGNSYLFGSLQYDALTGWYFFPTQAFKVRAWWGPQDQSWWGQKNQSKHGDPRTGRSISRDFP